MLNEIEIKEYSLPALIRNHDLDATVADFMAILESIDYNHFKRFSNVADEVSIKLLSTFLECEILIVVPDRYVFTFSIKAAERKHRTEDSAHTQEFGIIGNRKVPKSFQGYHGNSGNKTNLVKYQTF